MRCKAKLVIYKDKQFLVLKKKSPELRYCLLGGNVKKGEAPKKAALREAFEEGKVKVKPKNVSFLSSSINMDKKSSFAVYYFITEKIEDYKLMEKHKFDEILWVNDKELLKHLNKNDAIIIDRFVLNKMLTLLHL